MTRHKKRLKSPYPFFGGKSKVAPLIWERVGDVDNAIEPFFGSGAWLLSRPHPGRIETVNDLDCHIVNFWRATKYDPEGVVEWADWPVNEIELHAVHRWLVLGEGSKEFRERMRADPDYFDSKRAGRWCAGICMWIGGGFCTTNAAGDDSCAPGRRPRAHGEHGSLVGVHAKGLSEQMPGMIGGHDARGIHGQPNLDNRKPRIDGGEGQLGHGVHRGGLSEQVPFIGGTRTWGQGINQRHDGTCAARRAWLLDWFGRLRDRLRTVRVCCGDWLRVCDSESVTTRLGVTGIFLDPPYSTEAGRNDKLYAVESGTVAHRVREYCLERGSDPKMRICLAGYAGEGHEALEEKGWSVVEWATVGGYGNRTKKGKANAKKERLWFSPHCLKAQQGSFF